MNPWTHEPLCTRDDLFMLIGALLDLAEVEQLTAEGGVVC